MFLVSFKIDSNLLLSRIASARNQKGNILRFQNFAWKKSPFLYRLLSADFLPQQLSPKNVSSLPRLSAYISDLKKNKKFQAVLAETEVYRRRCIVQWSKNFKKTFGYFSSLGIKPRGRFTIYVMHPELRIGRNFDNNLITFGHEEEWPNYITVYIWHEILHSYFGSSVEEHSIIELLTDNELRIRLNGGKYPPFKGHFWLQSTKKKIFPLWKKYLKKPNLKILLKKTKSL